MNEREARRVLEEEGVQAFRGVNAEVLAPRLARAAPPDWTPEDLRRLVRMYLRTDDQNATARPDQLVGALGPATWRQFDLLLGTAGYTPRELAPPPNLRTPRGAPPQYDGEFAGPVAINDFDTVMQRYRVGVRDFSTELFRGGLPALPMPPCVWAPIVNATPPRTGRIVLPPPDQLGSVTQVLCPTSDSVLYQNDWCRIWENADPGDAVVFRSVRARPVLLGACYEPGNLAHPQLLFGTIITDDRRLTMVLQEIQERALREGWECWYVLATNSDQRSDDEFDFLLLTLGSVGEAVVNMQHCTIYESGGSTLTVGLLGNGRWGEVLDPIGFNLGPLYSPTSGFLRGWDSPNPTPPPATPTNADGEPDNEPPEE